MSRETRRNLENDGFRVLLAHLQEQTQLRSRHDTDLTPGFPELVAAAAQLPWNIVLDCVM